MVFRADCSSKGKPKNDEDTFDASEFCLKRSRLIRLEREGEVMVVEANRSTNVLLKCSYCGGVSAREPRVWWRWDLLTGSVEEVKLGEHVLESAGHSLVIRNVSQVDAAIYLCRLPYEDSLESSFNYLLDLVEPGNPPWLGDLSLWQNYSLSHIIPANVIVRNATYVLGPNEAVQFEAIPVWSGWTECEECVDQPKQRRTGNCRVRPLSATSESFLNESSSIDMDDVSKRAVEILLLAGATLPCRGSLLEKLLPQVRSVVQQVPDFLQEVPCAPFCPRKGGKKGPRERRQLILAEGGRAIVPCPGSTESAARWEYNKRRIALGDQDGCAAVDHFGSLHLVAVVAECKGNYTCIRENVRTLEVKMVVRSKGYGFTSGFRRHALYLAIASMMAFAVYCVVACGIYWRKKRLARPYRIEVWEGSRSPLMAAEEESDSEGYSNG